MRIDPPSRKSTPRITDSAPVTRAASATGSSAPSNSSLNASSLIALLDKLRDFPEVREEIVEAILAREEGVDSDIESRIALTVDAILNY